MQSEHTVDDLFAKELSPSKSRISSHNPDEFFTIKPRPKRNILDDNFYSLKEQNVTTGQESLDKEPLLHRMMSDVS